MVPRPRNKANKNLPQNLYFDSRRSSYRYRRPTDGKWFQFGTDRIKAIDAAKSTPLSGAPTNSPRVMPVICNLALPLSS